MKRFEYLVVQVEGDRVLWSNGHWQGELEEDAIGADESCPDLHAWLADAGAQGWDLVALDPEAPGTARLFFKRVHGA